MTRPNAAGRARRPRGPRSSQPSTTTASATARRAAGVASGISGRVSVRYGTRMAPTPHGAWALLCEWTGAAPLRRPALAVEAAVGWYGERCFGIAGPELETWRAAGLLHDFDYERFPETPPLRGAQALRRLGYPHDLVAAARRRRRQRVDAGAERDVVGPVRAGRDPHDQVPGRVRDRDDRAGDRSVGTGRVGRVLDDGAGGPRQGRGAPAGGDGRKRVAEFAEQRDRAGGAHAVLPLVVVDAASRAVAPPDPDADRVAAVGGGLGVVVAGLAGPAPGAGR